MRSDRYSQYLTAQVISSEGQPITSTKSSFLHLLSHLPWVPAYHLQPGGGQEVEYLCPNSIYLFSPEVHGLLGTHVRYLDMRPSELTQALGKCLCGCVWVCVCGWVCGCGPVHTCLNIIPRFRQV